MKLLRKSCAILLAMSLLLGCLPVLSLAAEISTDYTAKIDVSKISDTQAEVSFIVNANGKTVGNGNSVALAYDTSVFTLLNRLGGVQTITDINQDIGNYVGKSTYSIDDFTSFSAFAYAKLSEDGKTGYLLLQPTAIGNRAAIGQDSVLMSVLFGLAEGATWDSVTTSSIRLITMEEAGSLEQAGIVVLNDGYTTNYIYGYRNGEDTLAKPTFTYTGFTPAKEYPVCNPPTDRQADYGVTLNFVGLDNPEGNTPGTWKWENGDQLVGDVGDHIFTATFTPDDTDTYQTVTGIEVSVHVIAWDLGDNVFIKAIPDQTYTGYPITPEIQVSGDAGYMTAKDCTIEYADNTNVGTATVTVKAKDGGNYTFNEVTLTFQIVRAASAISISGDLDVTYGTAVPTANIQVTRTGSAGAVTYKYFTNADCTEGESAAAPTNAGSYWVKAYLAADDNYAAAESEPLAFTISPKEIAERDFTAIDTDAKTYTGSAIEPAVTSSLTEGTDYTVAYSSNINAGTGTITITGTGNYTGSVVKTFTISPKAIAESDFPDNISAQDYTGAKITPTVSSALTLGTDYTVAYGENINAGTGTITITGTGNYTGTVTKYFTISKIAYTGQTAQAVTVLSSTYDKNASSSYTADLSALVAPGGALGTPTKGEGTMVTEANVNDTSLSIAVTPAAAGTEQTITVPVSGCTNFNDYTITVTVTSVDKQPVTVTMADGTAAYDGQTHGLNVQWPNGDGTKTVTYAKDGVVSATAPKDAGTYTVTATYEDDTYYGTAAASLTITPKEAALTWSGTENLRYDGTAKNVTASVSNLVSGDSCAVTVTGGTEKDAGDHTAAATSLDNSNYKLPAEATKSYTISPKVITFAVTVTPGSAEYDGAAQTVAVTVKDGETVLTVDKDYSVTLPADMTNAGQKTITVSGAGNYAGSTGTGSFTISKSGQDTVNIDMENGGWCTYGDAPFTITVTGGSGEGAYSLTSSDPSVLKLTPVENENAKWTAEILKVGIVTLTANKAGDDNYEPATEATAQIIVSPKDIVESDFTFDLDAKTYTGSAIEPAVTSTALTAGRDYTVAYSENVNAGKGIITVEGQGNYTGTVYQYFTILPKSIADMTVSTLKDSYTYTGAAITPTVTVTDGSVTLVYGMDYYVTYSDNVDAGTATVTVTGQGNYTGTEATTFEIVAAPASGTVTITGTGSGAYQPGDGLGFCAVGRFDVLSYQWYNQYGAIEGETSDTYTLQEGDTSVYLVLTSSGNCVGSLKSEPIEVGKTPLPDTVVNVSVEDGDGDTAVNGVGDTVKITVDTSLTEDDYTIVWLRDGAAIPGASESSYTIAKEDQGKLISVKIVAKGDVYTGTVVWTEYVAAVKPDAPVLTASAGDQKVTLRWTAPYDGGSPLTGYSLTVTPAPDGTTSASYPLGADVTSFEVTGLTNGTEYTFTLTASNAEGRSDAGAVTATPKAPTGGGGGGGSVAAYTLTFDTNGGSAVAKVTKTGGVTVDLSKYTSTKDGYTFGGWYSDQALTNQVTSVKLDKNLTVYAKWIEQPADGGLPFTDVAESDWFFASVGYVYEAGIMNGVSATTFAPQSLTTRGQIVTMLYRLAGSPAVSGTSSFADVSADAYYASPVAWAAANGIVNGYSETTFGPDGNVTREQLAAILYRYAQDQKADVSQTADLSGFADAASVSEYAVPAMQWAVGAGIVNGRGENMLAPGGTATRAEVATMLMRFIENVL